VELVFLRSVVRSLASGCNLGRVVALRSIVGVVRFHVVCGFGLLCWSWRWLRSKRFCMFFFWTVVYRVSDLDFMERSSPY